MEKWLSSYNRENSPAVLLGDFNMTLDKLKKYIIKNFPDWIVANLTGSSITYSKGSKSSCVDHIIYFISKDYSRGRRSLKKISKLAYSVSTLHLVKSKSGQDLFDPNDQLKRCAEHYKDLASDSTSHSLNQDYWTNVFRNNPRNPNTLEYK